MTATGVARVLLLPERRRLAGQALPPSIAAQIGKADRLPDGHPGEQAQLRRYFDISPAGWPMAAIQRQHDAGDAGEYVWLRADPAHVRADMAGARLMAWGNLAIDDESARRFLTALQPVFEEARLEMSATAPDRWFLRLPAGTNLPAFALPEQALGADMFEHLPQGELGRRWRTMLSESQVILHNHAVNAERNARGQVPVNSLWFWGEGALPDSIVTSATSIDSADPEIQALFARSTPAAAGSDLRDLRHVRDWAQVEQQLSPVAELMFDFADGARWRLRPAQRWRFWRRPLFRIDA